MLKSWKFWAVVAVIGGLTAMFASGFGHDPKLVPSPLVHRPAPGFKVTELNTGAPLSLESLKGTPFVLNFFASWCVACRDEARLLESAYLRWGQDPSKLRVIGIAIQDTPEAARAFAKRYGKTYYLALDDAAGDVSLNYGLYGVPETFFVDAKGIIRYKQIGAVTPEVLEEQIPKLIASREQP
ncbi:MAG TPA: redoxin domain-containing protein [bacterium]|nr:redoxin domain-containing protein [bacterium]